MSRRSHLTTAQWTWRCDAVVGVRTKRVAWTRGQTKHKRAANPYKAKHTSKIMHKITCLSWKKVVGSSTPPPQTDNREKSPCLISSFKKFYCLLIIHYSWAHHDLISVFLTRHKLRAAPSSSFWGSLWWVNVEKILELLKSTIEPWTSVSGRWNCVVLN